MFLKTVFFAIFFLISGTSGALQCSQFVGNTATLKSNLDAHAANYSARALFESFSAHADLIYDGFQGRIRQNEYGFPVSNESGLSRKPFDLTPRDVVIGVGTNSVWDLAVRSNAGRMIILDDSPMVLLGQEYLFRPLILTARTPGEFFASLVGLRLPIGMNGVDLGPTLSYLRVEHDKISADPGYRIEERREFVEQKLEEIFQHPKFDDFHASFVAKFYEEVLDLSPIGERNPDHFGPFIGVEMREKMSPYFHQLRRRYDPMALRADGASDALLKETYFSPFSSPEAFSRLKKIFYDRVSYALSDISDMAFYLALGDKIKPGSSYLISASNIFTLQTVDPSVNSRRLLHFLTHVGIFLGESANTIEFHQSRLSNKLTGFEYFVMDVNSKNFDHIIEQMILNRFSPPELVDGRQGYSDFQQVAGIMLNSTPRVQTAVGSYVEMTYGELTLKFIENREIVFVMGKSMDPLVFMFLQQASKNSVVSQDAFKGSPTVYAFSNIFDLTFVEVLALNALFKLRESDPGVQEFFTKFYPQGPPQMERGHQPFTPLKTVVVPH